MKTLTPRARRWRLVAIVACVGLMSPLLVGSARAAAPSLELVGPGEVVELGHYKGQATYLDTGVLLASLGAPFEIELTRPDYTGPIMAAQVIDGTPEPLPADMPVDWDGFQDFFEIEITKAGVPVTTISVDFCPNSFDRQRVSDDGPLTPTYPEACFANPFTKGMVWGIDQDWATSTVGYYGTYADLANGAYEVTTSITEGYAIEFGVPEEARSITTNINVTTIKDPCHHGGCGSPGAPAPPAAKQGVPIMDNPAPSILPDLEALPAWGISVQNKKNGKSFVTFGATVWTSGADDMVVEGFRRDDEAVMDGFQYFHNSDGDVIGKSQVGTLEYDQRDGHNHWHFLQFAGYSLLDVEDETAEGIKSTKEAFCLAPTDAIDLSLDGAALNPQLGLSTACGSQNSRWIREILPLGWGDTYFQGLPGQSFNITSLPDGTYWIKVEANPGTEANPDGALHEQTTDNNIELREIQIGTKANGKRTVDVPPWNGIDTD